MALRNISTRSQTTWEIDPENTIVKFTIGWSPIHRVRGQFRRVRGTAVLYDDSRDDSQSASADYSGASIEVEIDAASIDTGLKVRDGHLHYALFLDVEHFPTVTFRSTRVEDLGQDRLRVVGDLRIRSITRQVTLDATVDHRDGERAKITASTIFDRRDFEIGPKPMGLMAGNTVAVEVTLTLVAR